MHIDAVTSFYPPFRPEGERRRSKFKVYGDEVADTRCDRLVSTERPPDCFLPFLTPSLSTHTRSGALKSRFKLYFVENPSFAEFSPCLRGHVGLGIWLALLDKNAYCYALQQEHYAFLSSRANHIPKPTWPRKHGENSAKLGFSTKYNLNRDFKAPERV